MVLDNCNLNRREPPKIYCVVSLENGRLTLKKNLTHAEAYGLYDNLNGSGIQTLITRTSEIIKKNV